MTDLVPPTDLDTRFAQLRSLAETLPAKEMEAALRARPEGLDGALDVVFSKLAALVDPGKVGQGRGVFQYNVLNGEAPLPYFLAVDGPTCTVGRGVREGANVTIGIRVGDLMQMVTGKLSGQRAFVMGKLKLSGDPMFGAKLGQWFTLS